MNQRRVFFSFSVGLVGLAATGCATIIQGDRQDLTVTSQPPNLCVTINGEGYGATPVVASLERNKTYVVEVHKDHYLPYQHTVVPVVNGMVWGNLLFGGLIGMAVDSGTGAGYEHSTPIINAYFPTRIEEEAQRTKAECVVSPAVLAERERAAQIKIVKADVQTGYQDPRGH